MTSKGFEEETSFEKQLKEQFAEATGQHFLDLMIKQKSELKTQILDKIDKLSYPCPCSDTDCHTWVNYTKNLKEKIKEIFEK